MTIEPVQVVEIVKLFGKMVWIESDFFGAKHVMVQHDAPGDEPFCYASFHYDYSHTSNSGVMQEATRVAMALGAVEPIECRNRGWPDNSQSEGVGLVIAAEKLAPWMSAALEDPSVCAEMKADAESFLEALDRVRNG